MEKFMKRTLVGSVFLVAGKMAVTAESQVELIATFACVVVGFALLDLWFEVRS